MAGQNVHEFNEANFKSEVLDSTTPVLVDFWAEWCGPCRMLAPTMDELAGLYVGKVKVGKVNTDHSQSIAVQFRVQAIPTVILFKGGQVVKTFVGLQPKKEFVAALDAALK
ncbi:MAG: thioredoxin [Phycisphaerae bacterium]|nr:thioredoxin [Phycisphaerae bacterium]